MDHPRHDILTAKTETTPERIAGMLLVGLFHVGLIYAIASGLAMRVVKQIPTEITAQVMPEEQPKETPPPPPQLQRPQLPSMPPPDIIIQRAPAPTAPITVTTAPPPATAPAPQAPPAPTSLAGLASTHTTPPYPEIARRLSEQGTVRLRLTIATDGSVTNAQIEQSSGSTDLDAAAVDWVKAHWRYKPATQNGQPVTSTTEAAVVFNLKNAR